MTAEETTFFERNRSCRGWETIPVCGAEADLKGSVMGRRADNPEKKESVRKFVAERHRKGEYVRPDAVMRETGTKMRETYLILEDLAKEGIINPIYAAVCPTCGRTATTYESLNDVPEDEGCPHCGSEFAVNLESLRVIYRKVR